MQGTVSATGGNGGSANGSPTVGGTSTATINIARQGSVYVIADANPNATGGNGGSSLISGAGAAGGSSTASASATDNGGTANPSDLAQSIAYSIGGNGGAGIGAKAV